MEAYGKWFGIFISILRESFYHFFFIFKPSDVANIIDFDNFMKMDAFGDDMGEKMIGSVIGALMTGPIVWRGHVLASILCLLCMKWMEKGKRVENITG